MLVGEKISGGNRKQQHPLSGFLSVVSLAKDFIEILDPNFTIKDRGE